MNLTYAIALEAQEEGGFLITCRDLPAVTSECETQEEAIRQGQGAIIAVLSAMIDDDESIPEASPPQEGEILVPLPGQIQQKILLYCNMQAQGVRMADMARTMKVTHQMVRRLLDPCHNSTHAQIDRATWALGMSMETSFRPLPQATALADGGASVPGVSG